MADSNGDLLVCRIDGHEVGFEICAYDSTRPLVIDPTLFYSTYLGDSGDDAGDSIAVDDSGNAYVSGGTTSANFQLWRMGSHMANQQAL